MITGVLEAAGKPLSATTLLRLRRRAPKIPYVRLSLQCKTYCAQFFGHCGMCWWQCQLQKPVKTGACIIGLLSKLHSSLSENLPFSILIFFFLMSLQTKALRKGVNVLVATPGRLEDLMNDGAARLKQVT